MSFKKDGEIKIFKPKSEKIASEEKPQRYTVDDLVKESVESEKTKSVEEVDDVSP